MEGRSSRSDNPLVVILLATALAAAAQPVIAVLRSLSVQPESPFPSLLLIAALIAISYLTRVRGGGNTAWAIPAVTLALSLRFLYYPGRHWADMIWLLHAAGDIFSFRVQLAALLTMGGAWATGILLAINGVEHDRGIEYLGTALGVLVAGTILSGLGALRLSQTVSSAASRSVPLFFSAAMAALAVSRLTTVRRAAVRSGNRGGAWAPWAILAGLIVFAIAIAAASSVDAAVPLIVIRALRFVLDLLASALDIILYPVALVVAWLYQILRALMRGVQTPETVSPDEGDGMVEWLELEELGRSTVNLRWVAAVIVIATGLFLLFRLLRRPMLSGNSTDYPYIEERLSLEGPARPHRRARADRRDRREQLDAVRAAFRDVLEWFSARDMARAPAVTASKFALCLRARLNPDGQTALEELMAEYLPIRYGLLRADATAARRVRALAARVKSAGPSPSGGVGDRGDCEGR